MENQKENPKRPGILQILANARGYLEKEREKYAQTSMALDNYQKAKKKQYSAEEAKARLLELKQKLSELPGANYEIYSKREREIAP